MARPERNNVDYFPFLVEEGKKMFYIEETYGNDGFAVFVKLLRELAKANYHYLDLSKKTTVMFLSAKCKVSTEILLSIINDLVELDKFDAELWNENKIIWCQDFIDSIQDAYKKRQNECIDRNGLIELLQLKSNRKPSKSKSKPTKSNINGDINPQSRVKESKLKESKEKTPPKNSDEDFLINPLNDVTEFDLTDEQYSERSKQMYEEIKKSDSKFERIMMNESGTTRQDLDFEYKEFVNIQYANENMKKDLREHWKHFVNWHKNRKAKIV